MQKLSLVFLALLVGAAVGNYCNSGGDFPGDSNQFLILNQWSLELIFSLEIDGFGSIYELILAFSFEKDCGGFDFGSQTTTPAIESTTEAVESTTHATGDCSVVLDIIKFQNNITDLSWSIDQAQLSWNQTEITRFSAYEKRIYTVTSNTTATSEQIFENVVNVFNVWTKDQFYLSLTYDIVIQIYHETAEQYTWGTVKQFCACA
uniref:Secreted protein n=1 Tax=Bursaphelenchus xylophilus TaxID=6326 RepID=A0A1I7S4H6_BURXY